MSIKGYGSTGIPFFVWKNLLYNAIVEWLELFFMYVEKKSYLCKLIIELIAKNWIRNYSSKLTLFPLPSRKGEGGFYVSSDSEAENI